MWIVATACLDKLKALCRAIDDDDQHPEDVFLPKLKEMLSSLNIHKRHPEVLAIQLPDMRNAKNTIEFAVDQMQLLWSKALGKPVFWLAGKRHALLTKHRILQSRSRTNCKASAIQIRIPQVAVPLWFMTLDPPNCSDLPQWSRWASDVVTFANDLGSESTLILGRITKDPSWKAARAMSQQGFVDVAYKPPRLQKSRIFRFFERCFDKGWVAQPDVIFFSERTFITLVDCGARFPLYASFDVLPSMKLMVFETNEEEEGDRPRVGDAQTRWAMAGGAVHCIDQQPRVPPPPVVEEDRPETRWQFTQVATVSTVSTS